MLPHPYIYIYFLLSIASHSVIHCEMLNYEGPDRFAIFVYPSSIFSCGRLYYLFRILLSLPVRPPTSDFRLGHMTCFPQWTLSQNEGMRILSRGFKRPHVSLLTLLSSCLPREPQVSSQIYSFNPGPRIQFVVSSPDPFVVSHWVLELFVTLYYPSKSWLIHPFSWSYGFYFLLETNPPLLFIIGFGWVGTSSTGPQHPPTHHAANSHLCWGISSSYQS